MDFKWTVNEWDLQILEGMPITDEVEELLRVLGPFYELVDEKKKISQISDLSTGRVVPPVFHFMGLETAPRVPTFLQFASCCTLSPFDSICQATGRQVYDCVHMMM